MGKLGRVFFPPFLAPKYSGLNKHFVRLPELGVVIKPSLAALPLYSHNPPLINLA